MTFFAGDELDAADLDFVAEATKVTTTTVSADTSTYTTTEALLATFSATLVSGRGYAVEADLAVVASAVASPSAEVSLVRLREDNLTGSQLAQVNVYLVSTSSAGFPTRLYAEYTAVSSGSKTFAITGVRNGGANSHKLHGAAGAKGWLRVRQLG
jgi:hypothetical protein